jgi:hypothetical protein
MFVLVFQEFRHQNGRRYRVHSERAQRHKTMEEVEEQVRLMKLAAVPPVGCPYSYDWQVYRLDREDDPMFAIRVGTTEPYVGHPELVYGKKEACHEG